MKKFLAGAGAIVLVAVFSGVSRASDDVTVIGYVSDSMCGLNHADMQAKHGGVAQFSDAACAKACVEGGGKYVLADRDGNRTYNLKDQKKIARYAGQRVQIKGDLKGDMLEIDKISAMP